MIDPADLIKAIDDTSVRDEWQRAVIGASAVGNECDAYLAMELRGFPADPVPPRIIRVFDLGKSIENLVEADVSKAIDKMFKGALVMLAEDPRTNKQWEYHGYGKLAVAHPDGLIFKAEDVADGRFNSPQMVVEIKSMKAEKWQSFKDDGVETSHPYYYKQMQMQIGFTIGKPQSCLFVAYNKDTSEYWAQIVPYDMVTFSALNARIELAMQRRVRRRYAQPTAMSCRWCFKKTACWEGTRPKENCRTCAHSEARTDGTWWCVLKDCEALKPCFDYDQWKPEQKA